MQWSKYIRRCAGLVACLLLSGALSAQNNRTYDVNVQKMNRLMQFVRYYYVDSADFETLTDKGIVEMLKQLDPHSVYVPKKEIRRMNEPLEGNIDGIGVQFQIIKDTIVVVEPV